LSGRFDRLDTSQFRRPLVVPGPSRQNAGAAGQMNLF